MKYPQSAAPRHVFAHLNPDQHIWLFLDYDGTLAEFAPNPDVILPDEALIGLLQRLTRHPRLHTAIISGRRLDHICALAPVEGMWLAGTYGIEMLTPRGKRVNMLPYDEVRPVIERIKQRWKQLLQDQPDFYLEDKGWSLAIHGNHAADKRAQHIIAAASRVAEPHLDQNLLHLLGGDKFLEVCPQNAAKPRAVKTILQQYPVAESIPVFLGDDDKDEAAFWALRRMGGIPILVAAQPRPSHAVYRLPSPQAARAWLEDVIQYLNK